ncbi:hypothetical protein X805_01020 [Sphaerotilus natans subsp. natans DSM 6575]|uniref:Type I-F CRISPR-associated protein Csy1 n=1 Tax=Sphaerotilus natans subsp. natans DSM 6575 TaxID=1286631 RepID=A0A059KS41_9BURK|nr:hypothetical protein X805_01020 [Sphaerotilus natans subsp. natans DSM 6575]
MKYIGQVQLATHLVKAVHPDPPVRMATNLLVRPQDMHALQEVGSHVLGEDFDLDATGNGAVNKKVADLAAVLMATRFESRSLLDHLQAGDEDIGLAFGLRAEQTALLADITGQRCPTPASHRKLKQLYWLTGTDALDDEHYHLLAPLYATSLAHRVFKRLRTERFGDAVQEAQNARKAGQFHERPIRIWPHLAEQNLGGTKPQNISQLNSERRGSNFLLASLPPQWRSRDVVPLLQTETLFHRFGRRPEVRRLVRELRSFLATQPPRNKETRDTRDDLADELNDQFLLFSAEMRELPPGWSDVPECRLPDCERAFLDRSPGCLRNDWQHELAGRYANWLNAQLGASDALKMGDAEHAHWRRDLLEALADHEQELNHAD